MENKYITVGLLYNDCVKLKSYCFIATMGVVVFAFRFALARSISLVPVYFFFAPLLLLVLLQPATVFIAIGPGVVLIQPATVYGYWTWAWCGSTSG